MNAASFLSRVSHIRHSVLVHLRTAIFVTLTDSAPMLAINRTVGRAYCYTGRIKMIKSRTLFTCSPHRPHRPCASFWLLTNVHLERTLLALFCACSYTKGRALGVCPRIVLGRRRIGSWLRSAFGERNSTKLGRVVGLIYSVPTFSKLVERILERNPFQHLRREARLGQ